MGPPLVGVQHVEAVGALRICGIEKGRPVSDEGAVLDKDVPCRDQRVVHTAQKGSTAFLSKTVAANLQSL